MKNIPHGPVQPYATTDDLLEWMRINFNRYGDIYQASVYGDRVYVINDLQYVDRVLLRNWKNYLRKGQAVKRIALSLGNGLISSNGDTWVRQRRMLQPAFKAESIRQLFAQFLRSSIELRAKWQEAASRAESVDVTHDVSLAVLKATLLAIFGDDYDSIATDFSPIAEESRNLEFVQLCASLRKRIIEIVNRRRTRSISSYDLLEFMMSARGRDNADAMSDGDLGRQAMTLVIAGHETTASVLNWIWYLLAKHPHVESKLFKEIDCNLRDSSLDFDALPKFRYTNQVIDEALRIYPPLWLMTRRAIADDQIGEYFVPAGTEIYISPFLLQRHPRLWEAPDTFDPERFSGIADRHALAHCPFGAGPRNCIGELFARIEMQVHLLSIARHLRLRIAEPASAEFVAGVNLLSRNHFQMYPELRIRAN